MRSTRSIGLAVLLLALASRALAVPHPVHAGAEGRIDDADADGIPDWVERITGTDPYDADSDGDGVPDGEEDRNRDGVVDPGETDPRVHGHFPGAAPYIPEPMVFDLVRPLGAARGELEVNTLFHASLSPYGGLAWAPEIEYAFADGYGIELELPMHDTQLDALKLALQGTLPEMHRQIIHGWQTIGEYRLDRVFEGTALYMVGWRPSRVLALFAMMGSRMSWASRQRTLVEGLFNPSVFINVSETMALGFEHNLRFGDLPTRLQAYPQLHWQVASHLRLQLGGGVELQARQVTPLLAARVIVE